MEQQQLHHGGASPAAQLPESLLVRILGKVPQKQRLKACALVNSAWAQAAAAATTDVDVTQLSPRLAGNTTQSLQAWLKQRAQQEQAQPRSLRIVASRGVHTRPCLELPWQGLLALESLDVTDCEVALAQRPSSAHPGRGCGRGRGRAAAERDDDAAALPLLRSIRLCRSDRKPSTLARLAQPHLTRLHLDMCSVLSTRDEGPVSSMPWLPAMVQRLTQLADLRLASLRVSDANLAPLSGLQQLRACAITRCSGVTAQCLTALRGCGRLSALEFGGFTYEDHQSWLDVHLPSGLASLRLEEVSFEPAGIIGGLQQLERLQIIGCMFLKPASGQEEPGAWLDGDMGPCVHASLSPVLFEALLGLTRLTHLTLDDVMLFEEADTDSGSGSDADEEADEDAGAGAGQQPRLQQLQQLRALTASSALRELVLSYHHWRGAALPANALLHILPPGRELPGLTSLVLRCGAEGSYQDLLSVDAPDLDRLAACCPNLRDLTLHLALVRGREALAALVGLQQRVGLTRLRLGGEAVEDADAPLLAEMEGLRSLELIRCPRVSDVGLEHLTALTDLQSLRVRKCSLSKEVVNDGAQGSELQQPQQPQQLLLVAVPPTVGAGGGAARQLTTVYKQVADRLERSPKLALLRVQQQREQLRKLTAGLQQERADRQAEVAALWAEVAALRAARGRGQ